MKKTLKRTSILTLFALLCVCIAAFAFSVAPYAVKADEAASAPSLTSFKTLYGASIRTDSETPGIRFVAEISKAEYDLVKDTEGFEIGMAIARVNGVSELKAKIAESADNAEKILKVKGEDNWVGEYSPANETEDTYRYAFAIIGLSDANLNVRYTALGYVKVNGTVYYSSVENDTDTARTPLQIAVAYMQDEPEDDLDFAYQIVDKVLGGEVPSASLSFDKTSYELDGTSATPVVSAGEIPLSVNVVPEDESVVKFEDGKLVGLKAGKTKITATVQGTGVQYTATADVDVKAVALEVTSTTDGIISYDTEGEPVAIKLNVGGSKESLAENVEANTYDLYSAIIDYRATNSITEAAAYTATVESANYKGSITTATFVAIDGADKLLEEAEACAANSGKYYYLTSDITLTKVGQSFIGQNMLLKVNTYVYGVYTAYMNINGCGYKISNNGVNAAFFERLQDSYIKNLVFEFTGTNQSNGGIGWFAYQIGSTKFENCYFKAMIDTSANETSVKTFAELIGCTFTNCIFELTDTTGDGTKVLLQTDDHQNTYANVAVISTLTKEALLKNTVNSETLQVYSNRKDLATSEQVKGWSEAWSFTEDKITLCDKYVRTTGKDAVTPTLTTDGIMTLNTSGERTTITVTKADGSVLTTFENVTATTYDLYSAIIDYRVTNSITEAEAYTVTVESANYKGSVTTETFSGISNFEELYNGVRATDGKYLYLTNDITVDATKKVVGRYPDQLYLICAQDKEVVGTSPNDDYYYYLTVKLDGRGHKISYQAESIERAYVLFSGFDNSYVKNLVIDYSATATYKQACNLFARTVRNSVFENCYFDFDIKLTGSSGNGDYQSLFGMSGSKFNNCIFDLHNASDSSVYTYDLIICPSGGAAGWFTNCAAISDSTYNVSKYGDDGVNIKDLFADYGGQNHDNFNRYTTLADFVANAENYSKIANDKLVIDSNGITLCGQVVATVTASETEE